MFAPFYGRIPVPAWPAFFRCGRLLSLIPVAIVAALGLLLYWIGRG
jgi:hypothetical protein